MAFGCTLRAPHGVLFVLPTIGNPVMYLAAVGIGAVVGCLILGILKKNVDEENIASSPTSQGKADIYLREYFTAARPRGETAGLFLCKAVNEKDRSLIDVLI